MGFRHGCRQVTPTSWWPERTKCGFEDHFVAANLTRVVTTDTRNGIESWHNDTSNKLKLVGTSKFMWNRIQCEWVLQISPTYAAARWMYTCCTVPVLTPSPSGFVSDGRLKNYKTWTKSHSLCDVSLPFGVPWRSKRAKWTPTHRRRSECGRKN